MAMLNTKETMKKLRNRYRLVIMNDDTYEEVVTFKLSRLSVYVALCTLFVLMVGLTVALIVFTPIKQYIPGYGNNSSRQELREMKYRTDSLEKAMQYKDEYLVRLKTVLSGGDDVPRDTNAIPIPKPENTND
jgi:sensor histidine kinase YesM